MARSSDLPYLIVGVVLGSIVLLIVAFIPFCLWRAWSKQSKGCFLGADLQDLVCLWINLTQICCINTQNVREFWEAGKGWSERKSQTCCGTP